AVKKYKPSAEVYRYVSKEAGVEIGGLMMVAAHAWDTTGALRAGAHAAFVRRPQQVLDPVSPKPDLEVSDMEDLAAQLLGEPKEKVEGQQDKKAEKEARAENLRVGCAGEKYKGSAVHPRTTVTSSNPFRIDRGAACL